MALEEEAAWGTATSSSVMAAMKRTATDMVGSADGKVRPPPPAGPAPSGESTFINQKLKPVGAPDGSRCWEDFYEMQAQVGEGMYGQVYKMKEKSSNETVALKKVRMANEKEGFPITAIREIKLLSKFADPSERRHPASGENIVRLKEIVNSKADADNDNKGDIFMVLEYMEHDLSGVRESPNCKLTMSSIKTIMNQILTGIEDCHSNKILHRDLKCSNVLMNRGGDVKLADFGLARSAGDKKRLTPKVITLWYRPPELLMGQQEYDYAVDIWSAGCILAELFLGKPLLPGRDESDQIAKIFDIFGTPREPPSHAHASAQEPPPPSGQGTPRAQRAPVCAPSARMPGASPTTWTPPWNHPAEKANPLAPSTPPSCN